jgi:hypothetical protein
VSSQELPTIPSTPEFLQSNFLQLSFEQQAIWLDVQLIADLFISKKSAAPTRKQSVFRTMMPTPSVFDLPLSTEATALQFVDPYNLSFSVSLKGKVDVDRLCSSLEKVLQR